MSFVMTASLVFNGTALAKIEKWIDANGQVHYADILPPGVDAKPFVARPNVIETYKIERLAITGDRLDQPPLDCEPIVTVASAPRTDIQSYIELCRENRGVDCEAEASQMINGPAPIVFRKHRVVFPRRHAKRPPPGLRLKFSIRP